MAGNSRTLKRALLKALKTELEAYGFKFDRDLVCFYRLTPYGKDMISVTFSHPDVGFDTHLTVNVRHDIVEDLIQTVPNSWPSEDWKPWTKTVGNNLSNMLGRWTTWHVVEESDIVDAVLGIMGVLRSFVFPYFERFSSLDEVFGVMMRRDAEEESLRGWGIFPVWAAHAVVLAYLYGRMDMVDEIETEANTIRGKLAATDKMQIWQHEFLEDVIAEMRRRWNVGNCPDGCESAPA